MDIRDMSNEEIKKCLEDHGLIVGPVTATTRKLYEKKLQKLGTLPRRTIVTHQHVIGEEWTPGRHDYSTEMESPEIDESEYFSTGYTPDGSNLTRRPLYSSPRLLQSPATIRTTDTQYSSSYPPTRSASSRSPSRSCWSYCRYILPLFIVVVLITLLVYYHMEENSFIGKIGN